LLPQSVPAPLKNDFSQQLVAKIPKFIKKKKKSLPVHCFLISDCHRDLNYTTVCMSLTPSTEKSLEKSFYQSSKKKNMKKSKIYTVPGSPHPGVSDYRP